MDFVYLPNKNQIYDRKNKTKIKLLKKEKILCAKYRKGHFEGVIDVMDRLTHKINPKKIFMGEKDLQQLYLVKKYIERKYRAKIIKGKTIRNKNKLALSSRNILLRKIEFHKAEKIAKDLIFFKQSLMNKKNIINLISNKKIQLKKLYNISIEYLELRNEANLKISNKLKGSKIFIAYHLGKVRLIDNF